MRLLVKNRYAAYRRLYHVIYTTKKKALSVKSYQTIILVIYLSV